MEVKCIEYKNGKGRFELEVDLSGLSMLDSEVKIQEATNKVANLVTEKRLHEFDADGQPPILGNKKYTSKGLYSCTYETPYGQLSIQRHLYQTSKGGGTFCPLNDNARILKKTCTPKLAKMISNKYGRDTAEEVSQDMKDNHSRPLAKSFIQNISDFVGAIADAKEEHWDYTLPEIEEPVHTIGVSMDGANVAIVGSGYREAMTGSITLYAKDGSRLHSMYLAVDPEYGKSRFFSRMESAITDIKESYPGAFYIGVSDGAHDLWEFLKKHTNQQVLDFYHATEYLSDASKAIFPKNEKKRKAWLEEACSSLKHVSGYVPSVLLEMNEATEKKLTKAHKEKLNAAITYFTNNEKRMTYPENKANNLPIGSGVIEAACKTIVKIRLCRSGMRWKNKGVKVALSLRAMIKTAGKWDGFWNRLSLSGVPSVA